MKITCTKREKEIILKAFDLADLCPFEENFSEFCKPGTECHFCCQDHIEWDVKDGDTE